MARRFATSALLAVASSTLLAGCFVLLNGQGAERNPIDPQPAGPIIQRAGGPPTECRAVPEQHCLENTAHFEDDALGVPRAEVERFVVSCIGACNAREGEFRIDVVLVDGSTRSVGGGGYATAGPMP